MNLPTPDHGSAVMPPHRYVPQGPIESAPYAGFAPRCVRRDAFASVLAGVELGAYDWRIVTWLVEVGDDTTCRTLASVLWRCRLAGVPSSTESEEA